MCCAVGVVDMRFNALRAKDRGTYVLHMDRNARGGQTLFRLQVTISIQVLGVCAARPPISRVPPSPLIAFFRLCPCDRFRAPCLDCTALRCAVLRLCSQWRRPDCCS